MQYRYGQRVFLAEFALFLLYHVYKLHDCLPLFRPILRMDSSEIHAFEARQAFAALLVDGEQNLLLANASLQITAEDDALGRLAFFVHGQTQFHETQCIN